MINVSTNFLTSVEATARHILLRAYIGDVLLTGDNLIDLTVTEAVSASDGISMGSAIASKLVMKIKMPDLPILLTGNSVRPEMSCYGIDEWVSLGKFYITEAVSNDDFETTFTITAYDAFSKTESVYIPRINMPNTAAEVLTDIAEQCGFPISEVPEPLHDILISQELADLSAAGVLSFPNGANVENGALVIGEFVSTSKDVNSYTCRQYIGYFAGLLGKNARFDRNGDLIFTWYSDSGYKIYRTHQYLGGCKRLTDQDYTVHSITSGSSGAEIVAGSGVGISFENPFMTQSILDNILSNIGTITYTPMQVKWRGNPAIEAGDIIAVEDSTGNMCTAYVMEQTIRVSGGLYAEIKCYGSSESAIAFTTSPTKIKLQQVYTKLQAALAEATTLLNGANGGVFEILDENGDGINDGWKIRSADDSQFIKANLYGIGITKDGGGTYEQAITIDGINASVIRTGEMSAQRISVGDETLGDVFSVELDENGHPVVTIGSSDSSIKQKQTNDAVTFVAGDNEQVAKFSTTGAEWADLQQMKYCGFVWTKSTVTGNVRFTKAGEN